MNALHQIEGESMHVGHALFIIIGYLYWFTTAFLIETGRRIARGINFGEIQINKVLHASRISSLCAPFLLVFLNYVLVINLLSLSHLYFNKWATQVDITL